MTYTFKFKQDTKEYYSLLNVFKEEIGFNKFSKVEKLMFWSELCDYDYNEKENSCGNFERLKEFIILKLSKEGLDKLKIKLKGKDIVKKKEKVKINLLKWRIFNGQKY